MKRTVPVWVMFLAVVVAGPTVDLLKRRLPSAFVPHYHSQKETTTETKVSKEADDPIYKAQRDASYGPDAHKARRSLFRAAVVLVSYDPEFNITVEPEFLKIAKEKKLQAPTDTDKALNTRASQAWNEAKNEAKAKVLKKEAEHFGISDAEAMETCLNHTVSTN